MGDGQRKHVLNLRGPTRVRKRKRKTQDGQNDVEKVDRIYPRLVPDYISSGWGGRVGADRVAPFA